MHSRRRTGPIRLVGWALASTLLVVLLTGPSAAQNDLSIKAFVGTWQGSGIATAPDDLFNESVRDLDVVIRTVGQGFTIDWTTVVRKGPVGNRKTVKRATSKTFQPTARPGIYRGDGGGDLLDGAVLTWARLEKQTLSVFTLEIDETGDMGFSRYDRTLTAIGMELAFTGVRGGETQRKVKGKLVKIAK